MVGPQDLIAVRQLDALERLLAGMGRGEGDVARRVPVLGQHHVLEGLGDSVDQRDDLVALGDREAASGQEAVLHVDDHERRIRAGLDLALRQRASHQRCQRQATGGGEQRAARYILHGEAPATRLLLSPA